MQIRTLMLSACILLEMSLRGSAQQLKDASRLTMDGDAAAAMVAGISRFLDAEIQRAATARPTLWKSDFTSVPAYEQSLEPHRRTHAKILGLIDARVPKVEMFYESAVGRPSLIAKTPLYEIHVVRWSVLPGMDAEGLLLEPVRSPNTAVIAIPEADWSPEQLVGLAPGVAPEAQYARRLAEQGCRVIVPALIDRKDTWSGSARFRFTNQPHREFVYRMAYEMGRHIIGYEVQKVLAAVDWLKAGAPSMPIGVVGYGEGGLLAMHSAAADRRIDAALVSGYFGPREKIWQEPLYRNVWSLVKEFGDAEMAGMIAPRTLVVEAAQGPSISGPPPATAKRRGAAPGQLEGPAVAAVEQEFARAAATFDSLGVKDRLALIKPATGAEKLPGSEAALTGLLRALKQDWRKVSPTQPVDARKSYDSSERVHRQFDQMVDFTQRLIRPSEVTREQFWSKADQNTLAGWERDSEWYRDNYWKEIIGKLPAPSEALAAEVRETEGTQKWRRYDVRIPLWQDVFAYGVLLVPRDIKPSERRPVVVCQHGLEGRPDDVIYPKDEVAGRIYHHFAAELADQGFVVFAPQLPYIGDFRILQRKANPLKLSVYSFILAQHERILDWLSEQSFVDAKRIGFYGLSYGGKTAVRVPPLLKRYALSICSGDFNEWVWKVSTLDFTGSYMFTHEWEIGEFDTGNSFNHSDLAKLMAPRPFMVERGHRDGVGVDEWVSYEYAKVRRFYDEIGIGDRTNIEYFNGPHEIHGVGTYAFLRKFLKWPEVPPGL
jgi:dienelactone hydrolase